MKAVNKGRWSAQTDQDFVVFIIGMRINRWWMVHHWLPPVLAMSRMIRELEGRPDLGFLSGETWFGRTILLIQYWRSFDQLEAFARASDLDHMPAWAAFNRRRGDTAAAGVFHETYRIAPGQFENMFVDMPPFLLGDCATLIEAKGELSTARGRLAAKGPAKPGRAAVPEAHNDISATNPPSTSNGERP